MENKIPSEFAGFVRDVGVRTFDRLAKQGSKLTASVKSVLRSWTRLKKKEKDLLFDELIAMAQDDHPGEAPAMNTLAAKKSSAKKPATKKAPAKRGAKKPAKPPAGGGP